MLNILLCCLFLNFCVDFYHFMSLLQQIVGPLRLKVEHNRCASWSNQSSQSNSSPNSSLSRKGPIYDEIKTTTTSGGGPMAGASKCIMLKKAGRPQRPLFFCLMYMATWYDMIAIPFSQSPCPRCVISNMMRPLVWTWQVVLAASVAICLSSCLTSDPTVLCRGVVECRYVMQGFTELYWGVQGMCVMYWLVKGGGNNCTNLSCGDWFYRGVLKGSWIWCW